MSQYALNAVAVRMLTVAEGVPDAPVFRGVSYCQAVHRAADGETLRIDADSIRVCGWAPAVLGLKQPKGRFEQGLVPRLPYPSAGLLLAPLHAFPGEPQVVIVQASFETLRSMIAASAPDSLWQGHRRKLGRSALSLFGPHPPSLRHRTIVSVNRLLARLARSARWRHFTYRLFRHRAVTIAFDALISRALADMSVCRNSTVLPLLTGRANVSHFCTGGITWGRNRPDWLTSGWPFPLFARLPDALDLRSPPGGRPPPEASAGAVRAAR